MLRRPLIRAAWVTTHRSTDLHPRCRLTEVEAELVVVCLPMIPLLRGKKKKGKRQRATRADFLVAAPVAAHLQEEGCPILLAVAIETMTPHPEVCLPVVDYHPETVPPEIAPRVAGCRPEIAPRVAGYRPGEAALLAEAYRVVVLTRAVRHPADRKQRERT